MIPVYTGDDTKVSANHTERLEPNQLGFNSPSSPVQPMTEAPQLMDMTLASSLLLTVVNTSGPFWHMSALLIFSYAALLVVHITSTSTKNLKSRINIRTCMYISPHVGIHSRGTREVRRAAGCYHWSKVMRLIHA